MKIGLVAPATRIEPALAEQVLELSARRFGADAPTLYVHPQCHLSHGHFAGPDEARASAFLEIANDPTYDALWFARGGYGAARIAGLVLPKLNEAARAKTYLGYSDAGFLLAGLYKAGFKRLAHGPMAVDITRAGGEAAIVRALGYLMGDRAGLEPSLIPARRYAAFNLKVLTSLLGAPLEPDLAGHVLMLEDVNEYMYAIDRAFFHLASQPWFPKLAGVQIGRFDPIRENDTEFGADEQEIARHWCAAAGVPYLGRADIGHDVDNKIVPFGAIAQE